MLRPASVTGLASSFHSSNNRGGYLSPFSPVTALSSQVGSAGLEVQLSPGGQRSVPQFPVDDSLDIFNVLSCIPVLATATGAYVSISRKVVVFHCCYDHDILSTRPDSDAILSFFYILSDTVVNPAAVSLVIVDVSESRNVTGALLLALFGKMLSAATKVLFDYVSCCPVVLELCKVRLAFTSLASCKYRRVKIEMQLTTVKRLPRAVTGCFR
jgi:hypothetical protein